jgi:hypothetical protein
VKNALAILLSTLVLGGLGGCFLQVNNSFSPDEAYVVDNDLPLAPDELYTQAYAVLQQNCIACHGEGLGRQFVVDEEMPEQNVVVNSLVKLGEMSKTDPASGRFLQRLDADSGIDSSLLMPQGQGL